MILEAERLGVVRDVLVIAAALSIQDPRERPVEQRPQADQQHARFTDKTSDFLTWLNLWRYLREQQRELSGSAFRRMCKREYLNYLRVREWQDFESQLRQVCKEMGINLGHARPTEWTPTASTRRCWPGCSATSGCWRSATARKVRGPREYQGARNSRFAIFPGSALKGANPTYLMAGELVETGRLWARQNAAIKPEWAEQIGAHLVKRTYSEPHWSKKRAAVMAYERVTLYGVPLVADRLVQYGRIDQALSREMFIRHALVYGEWSTPRRSSTARTSGCSRRPRSSSTAPAAATSSSTSTRCSTSTTRASGPRSSAARTSTPGGSRSAGANPDLLTFDPAMLTHDTVEEVREADYPQAWEAEGLTFPISYVFQPGTPEDGLTIDVPVATLNRVDADDFSWNVPGLREELVTSLLRSLPKNLRVSFVPAPNTAKEFLARVPAGDEPLLDALERYLRSTTGVVVPREAWDWEKVPEHLRPTYRVVDDAGAEQARGKDLEALKAPLQPAFDAALAEVASDVGLSATGQTTWTFGTIERVGGPATGRPRGAGASRRSSTRAPPSGWGCSARPTRPTRGTGSASDACCCWGCGPSTRSPGSTTPPSWGWPGRRTRPSPSSSTTCAPPSPARSSTRTNRLGTSAAFAALAERARRGGRRAPGGRSVRRAARARRLAADREADQRPRRAAHPGRHAGHARPGRRGWSTAASWARPGPTSCAATRRTSPLSTTAASGSTARSRATPS